MAPIEAAIAAAVMYKVQYKRSRVEDSIVKVPCPLSPHVSGVIWCVMQPHCTSIAFTVPTINFVLRGNYRPRDLKVTFWWRVLRLIYGRNYLIMSSRSFSLPQMPRTCLIHPYAPKGLKASVTRRHILI